MWCGRPGMTVRARRGIRRGVPKGSDIAVGTGCVLCPQILQRVSKYSSAVPLRRIALVTLLAFGCATVRGPVTASEEPAANAGPIAPPIGALGIAGSVRRP